MYSYINNIGNTVYSKVYDKFGNYELIEDKKFKPSLFIKSESESKYKGFIDNVNLKKIRFSDIYDYKDYIKEIGDNKIYGHLGGLGIINQYIDAKKLNENRNFNAMVNYYIDIEVISYKEFPDAINAKYPISAICLVRSTDRKTFLWGLRSESMSKHKDKKKLFNKYHMFLNKYPDMIHQSSIIDAKKYIKNKLKENKNNESEYKYYDNMLSYLKYVKNIRYREFDNDGDLLTDFIDWVSKNNIDNLIGYNSELYDMPYIFNRTLRLFDEDKLKKLSPFNVIRKTRHKDLRGNYVSSYDIVGINLIDYMNVYKKYSMGEKASWKLKDVSQEELNHSKIEHEESFWKFYHDRPQVYFEYNIVDTDLIYLLDKKLNYISIAYGMTHLCSLPLSSYEHNTILWDGYLAVYLKKSNIIIPPLKTFESSRIEGAYNKEPIPDIYNWVVSFDLNSLYPHLIMQYNISPETYVALENIKDKKLIDIALNARMQNNTVEPFPHSNGVDLTLDNKIDYEYIASHDLIMTPSGSFFKADKRGIAPIIMEKIYNDRKVYQSKSKELYNKYNSEKDVELKNKLKIEADIYNSEQYVLKIFLNSFYGAFLKDSFRYYNKHIGSSITAAGQLSIRFIINWINDFLNEEINTKNKDYVVASSTDSMYITLESVIKIKYNNKSHKETIDWLFDYADNVLSKELTRGYNILSERCHAFENKMVMGREIIADRAFWLNKRYYALRIFSDDKIKYYTQSKIKIVGFPIVKSTIPKCVKPKMREIIEMILDKKSARDIYQVLKDFKNEFIKFDYRDIAISSNVNHITKNINEKNRNNSNWKVDLCNFKKGKDGATHENSKGAIVFNNLVDKYDLGEDKKILEGTKAKFVFLKEPNPAGVKFIAFDELLYDEFGLLNYIDYDSQFTRVFAKIILDTLNTLNLSWKSTWKNKKTKKRR